MKQKLIDEFKTMDGFHNPKKLPDNTMTYLVNTQSDQGALVGDSAAENTFLSTLKVPSIAPGFTLDKTKYDGAKLAYSALPRAGTYCTYLTQITLDADIVAHRDLITVFAPILNQVDTLTTDSRVVLYTDVAGVPGSSLSMDTFGNAQGVKENDIGVSVEKIGTLKPHYAVSRNNLSNGATYWIGLQVVGATVNDLLIGTSPYSSSTVYYDPVTPGTFVDGGTSLMTIVPVFANGAITGKEDEYLFKQLQLNVPFTSFSGQHDWAAASSYGSNQQYRFISDPVGLTHVPASGTGQTFVGAGILPAFTPLIRNDSGASQDWTVSYVAGIDSYTFVYSGQRISTFTRPEDDPSATATYYTDDKVILGVGKDGIIFITYPKAPHCIPIGFSPFAYNPGRVAAPATEPPSSPRSLDAVVFGDWLVITSPHSLNNPKPFYVRLIYRNPSNGIAVDGPGNFTMSSSLVPDLPKRVGIQTETLTFWGSEGQPSSIFYSVRGEVDSFEGFTSISLGSPIVATERFKDDTIIFFSNEIHRFSGTPTSAFSYQKIADFGISQKGMTCSDGDVVYFYSPEKGFTIYNGAFRHADDVFLLHKNNPNWYFGRDEGDWMIFDYKSREVLFSINERPLIYTYDVVTGGFSIKTTYSDPKCVFNASYFRMPLVCYTYSDGVMLHKPRASLDVEYSYAAIEIQTGYLSMNPTQEEVMFQDLHLNIDNATGDFTGGEMTVVVNFYNTGSTAVKTITFNDVDYDQHGRTVKLRLDYKARYVEVVIKVAASTKQFKLVDMRITAQDGGMRN
jgi:hypothetical protein